MNRSRHLAMYGKIGIERMMCPECKHLAFIIDGQMACCDMPVEKAAHIGKRKRVSDVPVGRSKPPKRAQKRILAEQDYTCFWCARSFGRVVYRRRRSYKLRITWDHIIPYVYSLDNREHNFVASCQVCNALKVFFHI